MGESEREEWNRDEQAVEGGAVPHSSCGAIGTVGAVVVVGVVHVPRLLNSGGVAPGTNYGVTQEGTMGGTPGHMDHDKLELFALREENAELKAELEKLKLGGEVTRIEPVISQTSTQQEVVEATDP